MLLRNKSITSPFSLTPLPPFFEAISCKAKSVFHVHFFVTLGDFEFNIYILGAKTRAWPRVGRARDNLHLIRDWIGAYSIEVLRAILFQEDDGEDTDETSFTGDVDSR